MYRTYSKYECGTASFGLIKLVGMEGVEPPRLSAQHFECCSVCQFHHAAIKSQKTTKKFVGIERFELSMRI